MAWGDTACTALLGWVALASLLGFVLGVHDKRQARRARRRVPERTFHGMALFGAWPGLLVAFLLVRHKTRKGRFLLPFLLISLLNAVALVAFAMQWDC